MADSIRCTGGIENAFKSIKGSGAGYAGCVSFVRLLFNGCGPSDLSLSFYKRDSCYAGNRDLEFSYRDGVAAFPRYISVSYTHLDVYKRQPPDPALCLLLRGNILQYG